MQHYIASRIIFFMNRCLLHHAQALSGSAVVGGDTDKVYTGGEATDIELKHIGVSEAQVPADTAL